MLHLQGVLGEILSLVCMETVQASLNRPSGTTMASQPSHRLIGYYATHCIQLNELPFVLFVHTVSHFCCSRSPETDSRRLVSQEELNGWTDVPQAPLCAYRVSKDLSPYYRD